MNPRIARRLSRSLACLWLAASVGVALVQQAPSAWRGVLRDAAGNPVAGATVSLRETGLGRVIAETTDAAGRFTFTALGVGEYSVSVSLRGREAVCRTPLAVREGERLQAWLELAADQRELVLRTVLPLTSRTAWPVAASGSRAGKFRACRSTSGTSANCCCSPPAPPARCSSP